MGVGITKFTVSPSTGKAPLRVTFSAEWNVGTPPFKVMVETGDPDHPYIERYPWYQRSIEVEYTYARPGTYYPRLIVVDTMWREWHTEHGEVKVEVTGAPPELKASISVPETATVGETVFIGLAVEGGVKPYSGTLDFGDGSSPLTWTYTSYFPSVVRHVYKQAGSYTVRFTVTDYAGSKKTVSRTIKVEEAPAPKLEIYLDAYPLSGYAPLTTTLKVSFYGGKPPYSGTLSYGDGSSDPIKTSEAVWRKSHTYAKPGRYKAVAEVVDSVGQKAVGELWIEVKEVEMIPLKVSLEASPRSGDAPLEVSFKVSWEGGVPPYTLDLHFGDGGRDYKMGLSGPSYETRHVYQFPGTYEAKVYVTDSSEPIAQVKSASVSIAVKGAPPPTCKEGETRCMDSDLYVCKAGKWVLEERDSLKCKLKKWTPYLVLGGFGAAALVVLAAVLKR